MMTAARWTGLLSPALLAASLCSFRALERAAAYPQYAVPGPSRKDAFIGCSLRRMRDSIVCQVGQKPRSMLSVPDVPIGGCDRGEGIQPPIGLGAGKCQNDFRRRRGLRLPTSLDGTMLQNEEDEQIVNPFAVCGGSAKSTTFHQYGFGVGVRSRFYDQNRSGQGQLFSCYLLAPEPAAWDSGSCTLQPMR